MTAYSQVEWDQKLKDVPIRKSDPSKWPTNIRPLTFDDMDFLAVDKDGVLYWDGKPVMIRRKFELRLYELILATLAAAATVVQAVMAVLAWVL
jgi:hypothetical protein